MPVRLLVPIAFAIGLEMLIWILKTKKKTSKIIDLSRDLLPLLVF